MKRPFVILGAIALAFAASFSGHHYASADWGDEDELLPLTATLKSLTSNPLLASIEMRHCKPAAVATWQKSVLRFQIKNDGTTAANVAAVRTGLLSWNNAASPYTLTEVTSGPVDITVVVSQKLLPRNKLGFTSVQCSPDGSRIQSASISVNVQGLILSGVRNVGAHEGGHALGLGHADKQGDLMSARFNLIVNSLKPICPSNLDLGALKSKTDPYSIATAKLSIPTNC